MLKSSCLFPPITFEIVEHYHDELRPFCNPPTTLNHIEITVCDQRQAGGFTRRRSPADGTDYDLYPVGFKGCTAWMHLIICSPELCDFSLKPICFTPGRLGACALIAEHKKRWLNVGINTVNSSFFIIFNCFIEQELLFFFNPYSIRMKSTGVLDTWVVFSLSLLCPAVTSVGLPLLSPC